jgi:hypothetical protein
VLSVDAKNASPLKQAMTSPEIVASLGVKSDDFAMVGLRFPSIVLVTGPTSKAKDLCQ